MKRDQHQIISLVYKALSYKHPITIAPDVSNGSGAAERVYKADLRDFSAWCRARGRSPRPAAPEDIVAYLADLALRCREATMKRRVASISQWHVAGGYESPTELITVMQVVRGARRAFAAAKVREKYGQGYLYHHQQKAIAEYKRKGKSIVALPKGAGKSKG